MTCSVPPITPTPWACSGRCPGWTGPEARACTPSRAILRICQKSSPYYHQIFKVSLRAFSISSTGVGSWLVTASGNLPEVSFLLFAASVTLTDVPLVLFLFIIVSETGCDLFLNAKLGEINETIKTFIPRSYGYKFTPLYSKTSIKISVYQQVTKKS